MTEPPAEQGMSCPVPGRFNSNQDALIKLSREAKRKGITTEEAEILKQWAKEYGLPYRGVEIHPNRNFDTPHIHIGPIDHIPIK